MLICACEHLDHRGIHLSRLSAVARHLCSCHVPFTSALLILLYQHPTCVCWLVSAPRAREWKNRRVGIENVHVEEVRRRASKRSFARGLRGVFTPKSFCRKPECVSVGRPPGSPVPVVHPVPVVLPPPPLRQSEETAASSGEPVASEPTHPESSLLQLGKVHRSSPLQFAPSAASGSYGGP